MDCSCVAYPGRSPALLTTAESLGLEALRHLEWQTKATRLESRRFPVTAPTGYLMSTDSVSYLRVVNDIPTQLNNRVIVLVGACPLSVTQALAIKRRSTELPGS